MKTILLALTLLTLSPTVFAQKEMPTKEETINYLNKKISEINGIESYNKAFFKGEGDNVVIGTSTGTIWRTTTFKPIHIKTITRCPIYKNHRITCLSIDLTGPYAIGKSNAPYYKESNTINALFDFPVDDGSNFKKIKNALLHLRDLYKAEEEEDPFAN